jgi:glycine/sarcosine N-methyltransferase
MDNDYDHLSHDYHWLAGEELLSGEFFLSRHRALLDALSPDARIPDCACGIGSDAIGLARRGYQVTASDANGSMVAEAERRARAAAVDIQFATCQWEDLPGCFSEPFDLVLCVGNSISHTLNRGAALRALAAMHAVIKPGGGLLVGTRNWEKLRREQVRTSVTNSEVVRGGIRCISVYLWSHQADWDAQHHVELLLIFEQDGQTAHRRYALPYRPIRHQELRSCMEEVGFAINMNTYSDDADWYEIEGGRRA